MQVLQPIWLDVGRPAVGCVYCSYHFLVARVHLLSILPCTLITIVAATSMPTRNCTFRHCSYFSFTCDIRILAGRQVGLGPRAPISFINIQHILLIITRNENNVLIPISVRDPMPMLGPIHLFGRILNIGGKSVFDSKHDLHLICVAHREHRQTRAIYALAILPLSSGGLCRRENTSRGHTLRIHYFITYKIERRHRFRRHAFRPIYLLFWIFSFFFSGVLLGPCNTFCIPIKWLAPS